MGNDRRNSGIARKKMKMKSYSWICIYLLCTLGERSIASQDDTYKHATESSNVAITRESIVSSSTERTNNAIPEAEEGLRKYGTKKLTLDLTSEQLNKPYPYSKSQIQVHNHKKTSTTREANFAKRSGSNQDVIALNGTLDVSLERTDIQAKSESTTTTPVTVTTYESETESNTEFGTEAETEGDVETMTTTYLSTTTILQSTEISATDDYYTDSTTTGDSVITDETTYDSLQNTQYINNTTTDSDSNTVSDDRTSSDVPSVTTTSATLPGESTTAASITTSTATGQPEENNTESIDVLSTNTELFTTTLQAENWPTTSIEGETTTLEPYSSTQTTAETTIETIVATNATTLSLESTKSKQTAIIPVTETELILTTSPTTSKETTSSTTTSSITNQFVGKTSVKTSSTIATTSETRNSVFTWQSESSESTTDFVSPTPPSEDVTLLIRIVFEGTWHDICSKLPILRQSLAELVNSSVEKPISPRQIVFHQTQCSENLTPTPLMSEVPLTSVLLYVVDENGNFDGSLTKILPSLYDMMPINFPLTIHSFVLVQEADSGNAIAVVIVSCVAFICLILLAGLLFIMRKRQGRFNYGERCRPVSLDAYSLDSVSAYNSVRRSKGALRCSKRSYGNPTFEDSSAVPSHPLNFAGLSAFCDDRNAIAEEFASIPQVTAKIDELPSGAELKNRYANVIPLPETRVPLQRLNNDPLTEYINASYVRGPKNANKYYIACQAPTETTVADFWRMIWEQQCKVIIMLTDLVENGVEKCTEYIPPLEVSDCHRLYGDFQVTLKKREAKEKYAISTLHLKNLENNTFREVSHIWYLWPANGAPTDAAGLIAVLLEARALQRGATGPIVVHCSPGTGRTGTLIALDLGIRQYEITRTVDVPRVIYTIRRDRAGAVQTREQYAFIYKALNLYASKLAGGSIEST